MDDHGSTPEPPGSGRPGRSAGKIGRRTAIKAGIATTAGVVLGTTYIAPTVVSAGIQESYNPSAPGKSQQPTQEPGRPPEQPGRGRGRGKNKP